MSTVKQFLRSIEVFLQDENGASAAEYALILAIGTTGIAVAVIFLGDQMDLAITEAATCVSSTGC